MIQRMCYVFYYFIFNFCPIFNTALELKPLSFLICSTLTPYFLDMSQRLSPDLTVCTTEPPLDDVVDEPSAGGYTFSF